MPKEQAQAIQPKEKGHSAGSISEAQNFATRKLWQMRIIIWCRRSSRLGSESCCISKLPVCGFRVWSLLMYLQVEDVIPPVFNGVGAARAARRLEKVVFLIPPMPNTCLSGQWPLQMVHGASQDTLLVNSSFTSHEASTGCIGWARVYIYTRTWHLLQRHSSITGVPVYQWYKCRKCALIDHWGIKDLMKWHSYAPIESDQCNHRIWN
jgi:hypothetical protein